MPPDQRGRQHGLKKVAIYVRVSTDHQTVENQLQELEEVARRQGWIITATFIDEGISGAKGRDKRPASMPCSRA